MSDEVLSVPVMVELGRGCLSDRKSMPCGKTTCVPTTNGDSSKLRERERGREREEEESITSDVWRVKHNSQSRAAGADQP